MLYSKVQVLPDTVVKHWRGLFFQWGSISVLLVLAGRLVRNGGKLLVMSTQRQRFLKTADSFTPVLGILEDGDPQEVIPRPTLRSRSLPVLLLGHLCYPYVAVACGPQNSCQSFSHLIRVLERNRRRDIPVGFFLIVTYFFLSTIVSGTK